MNTCTYTVFKTLSFRTSTCTTLSWFTIDDHVNVFDRKPPNAHIFKWLMHTLPSTLPYLA